MLKSFTEIKQELRDYLTANYTRWSDDSTGNLGEALLDLFSYIGEALYYEADAIFTEAFIDTAKNKGNVVKLARMFGYEPFSANSAVADVTITVSKTGNVLPKGAELIAVANNTEIPFYTAEATLFNDGIQTVSCIQGRYRKNYLLGVSTGASFQRFVLPDHNLVYVDNVPQITLEVNGEEWTPVSSLFMNLSNETKIYAVEDIDGVVTIQFGDGVIGDIPPAGAPISVSYGYDNMGAAGNVGAGSISKLPGYSWIQLVSNAESAGGGLDAESIESIKTNALRMFQTQNRAITRQDFEALARTITGVKDAAVYNVDVDTNTVTLMIYPEGGVDTTALEAEVSELIEATRLVCTQMNYIFPTPIKIYISGTIGKSDGYTEEEIRTAVETALNEKLRVAATTLYLSDVYQAIMGVTGVENATVDVLTLYPSFESADIVCDSFTPKSELVSETITVTSNGDGTYTMSGSVSGDLGSGTFGVLKNTSIYDIILTEANTTNNGDTFTFKTMPLLTNISLPITEVLSTAEYNFTIGSV